MKRNKIIYWIATLWLALGMASTGIVQMLKVKEETENMNHLGYPLYLLTLLGVWKILGVVTVLIPKFTLLRVGVCRILLCYVWSHNITFGCWRRGQRAFWPYFIDGAYHNLLVFQNSR